MSRSAQAEQSLPAPNASAAAVGVEIDIIKSAREAAIRDDDAAVDNWLIGPAHSKLKLANSVALARRAAAVCGWLRNDNEYARATKLARRAIARLAGLRETNDTDHVERLYWEAMLEGEILNQKQRAVNLLREAQQIAPNDKRLHGPERRWSSALAEFGK